MKGNLVFYTGLSKALALTHIAPAFARNCARFIRFLQTLRAGALRRALLFLSAIAPRSAAIDNRGLKLDLPSLTLPFQLSPLESF